MKRYSPEVDTSSYDGTGFSDDCAVMDEDPNGDWVKRSDALAAIEEQKTEPKGYLGITVGGLLELKKVHKFNIRDGVAALKAFSEKHDITHREALYIYGMVKSIPNKLPKSTQD